MQTQRENSNSSAEGNLKRVYISSFTSLIFYSIFFAYRGPFAILGLFILILIVLAYLDLKKTNQILMEYECTDARLTLKLALTKQAKVCSYWFLWPALIFSVSYCGLCFYKAYEGSMRGIGILGVIFFSIITVSYVYMIKQKMNGDAQIDQIQNVL
jgi:preprotein translocase subunit SecG